MTVTALTIKQMETFVWVADLGSFRAAAERLHTTQPNISARMAALEAAVGHPLFTRDAGAVQLTPKGRDLLAHARNVLAAVDGFVVAAGQDALIAGMIRLGVTELIVQTWLPQYLAALAARFPKLTVELTVDMSVRLSAGLFDRTLDLCLQNGPFTRMTSGNAALATYPLVWVVSPGALPACSDAAGLATLPVLTHARDTRLYSEVAGWFSQMGQRSVRLVPSSNLAACLHMCLQGMGAATLPEPMVRAALQNGDLALVDVGWTPEPLAFAARYDATRAPQVLHDAAALAVQVAAGLDQKN